MPEKNFLESACVAGLQVRKLEALGLPVVVGEWSLATDNCAMYVLLLLRDYY